jgi:hypothetical protein
LLAPPSLFAATFASAVLDEVQRCEVVGVQAANKGGRLFIVICFFSRVTT